MANDHTKLPVSGTRLLLRGATELWTHRAMRVTIESGVSFALTAAGLTIGTDADNTVVLADDSASAHHASISMTPEGALITDRGSTNGTYVDGLRVRAAYLRPGALIEIGSTRLTFIVDPTEVATALSTRTSFGELLGHSPAMRAAFSVLEQVAKTDTTLLLTGESGTGKELAARALHQASARRDGPYVVFDCGAASASLIESALFGHSRGAFTGATRDTPGIFEEADGGTLVLDEIGELPLELQPKLLRAIETRTVTRLGENSPRSFDVRFIASTHRHLPNAVAAGTFRQDLFFRLSVIAVTLPPLRERREEIPRLVAALLSRLSDNPPDLGSATLRLLEQHDWPGNVRELRNVLERLLTLRDLPVEAAIGLSKRSSAAVALDPSMMRLDFHAAKQAHVELFERAYLAQHLADAGRNVSEAARTAGLSRQNMHRLINKHGLGDA